MKGIAIFLICLLAFTAATADETQSSLTEVKEVTQIQETNNDGTDFLKGFANGISPTCYDALANCFDNISQDTLNRITNDINKLSIKDIDGTLNAIQDIAEVFLATIIACKATSQPVQDLIAKLSEAFEKNLFISAAKVILKNPIKFAKLVGDTINDFRKHNMFGAGQDLGTFVGQVLGTRITPVESFVEQML